MYDFPRPPPCCSALVFADDITITVQAASTEEARRIVQPYLNSISRWAIKWRLNFSPSKSCTILFSRKLLPQAPPEFSIDNTLIPIATHTRFLGVIFDHKLSWKLHIDSLLMKVQKRSQLIKLLCSHKYGPDISTVAILYKSLIRSIIDYGSIVLATAPSSLIQKLDVSQNSSLFFD